jgi:hypothetical protein
MKNNKYVSIIIILLILSIIFVPVVYLICRNCGGDDDDDKISYDKSEKLTLSDNLDDSQCAKCIKAGNIRCIEKNNIAKCISKDEYCNGTKLVKRDDCVIINSLCDVKNTVIKSGNDYKCFEEKRNSLELLKFINSFKVKTDKKYKQYLIIENRIPNHTLSIDSSFIHGQMIKSPTYNGQIQPFEKKAYWFEQTGWGSISKYWEGSINFDTYSKDDNEVLSLKLPIREAYQKNDFGNRKMVIGEIKAEPILPSNHQIDFLYLDYTDYTSYTNNFPNNEKYTGSKIIISVKN